MYLARGQVVLGMEILQITLQVQFAIVGIYGKKDLKVSQLLGGYRKRNMAFSFIKEILNSMNHDTIYNHDEPEFEETKNTDKVIQLNLSYNEVLTLHYLIMDKINKGESRDTGQLTDYLDTLKKIDKEIIVRWNNGQNIRK